MPRVSKGIRKNAKTKPDAVPAKFVAGFIAKLDGRTEIARALRERFDAICADLGGEGELSHIKLGLVERYTWLEAVLQGIEGQLAAAQACEDPSAAAKASGELIARWVQACNTLMGMGKTLGLERKSTARPWSSIVHLHQENNEEGGK